jgi:nucleoside-diphosphate-sugar epimerase
MRAFITGASGFVGSHVVQHLAEQGHSVFAAARGVCPMETPYETRGKVQAIRLDLKNHAEVRSAIRTIRPELTIHLSWCTQRADCWTTTDNLDYVEASLHLAHALNEFGCRRLVVAGSCVEYDWDYGYLSEDTTPLHPCVLYGASKNALRQMLEAFCAKKNMPLAWLRLFNLYGPRDRPERLVPSVILSLSRGDNALCTRGEQIRDFLHVDDAAAAFVKVSLSNFTGALNIASGEPVSVKSIVETIAGIMNARDRVALGALPTDPSHPAVLVADIRKLFRTMSWRPSRDLRQGLSDTVTWWQSQASETHQANRQERDLSSTTQYSSR